MRRATMAIAVAAAFAGAATGAAAQQCWERTAEANAPSRDAAIRSAYSSVLRAVDPGLVQAWTAGGQRLGDAPGYTVRKLTNNCTPGGAGQTCRISATICRN